MATLAHGETRGTTATKSDGRDATSAPFTYSRIVPRGANVGSTRSYVGTTGSRRSASSRLVRAPGRLPQSPFAWPAASTAPHPHHAPRCRASATPTPIPSPGDLARRSAGLVQPRRAVHERARGPSAVDRAGTPSAGTSLVRLFKAEPGRH